MRCLNYRIFPSLAPVWEEIAVVRLLNDYTGAELEELDEQQVQRLIDLECADAGLPFAPEAPSPYVPLKQERDVRLYQVGKTDVLVSKREDAEAISRFLAKHELWTNAGDWRYSYNTVAKRATDDLEVSVVDTYSPARMQERKDALAHDAELKAAHEKATTEYEKACDARNNVSANVWKIMHQAWAFKSERESLLRQLDRCIELADGNNAIGLRFFEKAHTGYKKFFSAAIKGDRLVISHERFTNPDNNISEIRADVAEEVAF